MEPMALGSSPPSPPPSNFLPNFLLGNNSSALGPSTPSSPLMGPHHLSRTPIVVSEFSSPTTTFRDHHQKTVLTPTKEATFPQQKPGPPSQGLFDTLDSAKWTPTTSTSISDNTVYRPTIKTLDDSITGANRTRPFEDTFQRSLSYCPDTVETLWVTAFGFPSSALGLVLAQLAQCGAIVEKRLPCPGNWIQVKFSNATDASRALALNGRCITNSIMIGVIPYHNKENRENTNCANINTSSNNGIITSPIRARPLRQSFVNCPNNTSVLQQQNLPQKTTGLVSKAMEYVFGW